MQRPGPSSPGTGPPTGAVHIASLPAEFLESFAPLPTVDLEDAIVGASISFMVYSR